MSQSSPLSDPLFSQSLVDFEKRSCGKPWTYANGILQKVSRTFALNIVVLPLGIRKPVLLAYLFCRMADTIEDDAELSSAQKRILLQQFSDLFDAPDRKLAVQIFVQSLPLHWAQGPGYDQILTYYLEWPLDLLFDGPDKDRIFVRKWVREMCKGMSEYCSRREESDGWFCLRDAEDLDRYCYYVAGTVGFMLCDLFYLHSVWIGKGRQQQMLALANSFGLALQVTNIVKDIREDWSRQTSFLPETLYRTVGVDYRQLMDVDPQQLRPVIHALVRKALGHLRDARDYSLLIPRIDFRIRLFCIWPMFLSLATLRKVAESAPLSQDRIKISRDEVQEILSKASKLVISNNGIKKMFAEYEQAIEKQLNPLLEEQK